MIKQINSRIKNKSYKYVIQSPHFAQLSVPFYLSKIPQNKLFFKLKDV